MKMLIKKSFLMFLLLLLMGSCSKKKQFDASRYMAVGEVEYIDKFPMSQELSHPQEFANNILGKMNFKIVDSLMFVGTNANHGIWKIVSLNTGKKVLELFDVGSSKFEFIFPPSVITESNFYKKSDSLYVDVFESQKGLLLTVNVTNSFKNPKSGLVKITKGLNNQVFCVVRLKDGKYLVREINDFATKQIRTVRDLESGKQYMPSFLEGVNAISVNPKEDFNILSTIIICGSDDRVIEMPLWFNYINIYKIDGSFTKTICLGEKMDALTEVTSMSPAERKYVFADVRVYDKFFGVLKLDVTNADFQKGLIRNPTILLFSLSGQPLMEFKLHNSATSFDIDLEKGWLFALDERKDKLLKYNIKKELNIILSEIK